MLRNNTSERRLIHAASHPVEQGLLTIKAAIRWLYSRYTDFTHCLYIQWKAVVTVPPNVEVASSGSAFLPQNEHTVINKFKFSKQNLKSFVMVSLQKTKLIP